MFQLAAQMSKAKLVASSTSKKLGKSLGLKHVAKSTFGSAAHAKEIKGRIKVAE